VLGGLSAADFLPGQLGSLLCLSDPRQRLIPVGVGSGDLLPSLSVGLGDHAVALGLGRVDPRVSVGAGQLNRGIPVGFGDRALEQLSS
jgi:hypothetical protein